MNIIGPDEESEYVTQDSTNAELLSDEENTYFDCKQCLARFDMEKHLTEHISNFHEKSKNDTKKMICLW